MIQASVPESADGGYWYLVQAVFSETGSINSPEDPPPLTPGDIPGAGWCAWYLEVNGVFYAAVRTPKPVSGVVTVSGFSVADVIAGVKPRGRIGGG